MLSFKPRRPIREVQVLSVKQSTVAVSVPETASHPDAFRPRKGDLYQKEQMMTGRVPMIESLEQQKMK